MNKTYYTRSEVEQILGVSASTVKRLLSVGILDGWQESGQSGTGKVWCVSIESVQKYARENNIELTDLSSVDSRPKSDSVDRNVSDSRQSTVDQTVAQPVDSRPKKNKDAENKEVKPVGDSRSQTNSVDRTVSDSRPDTSARSTVDRELQAEMAILKKELELTKKQLDTATEDYRKDKDFLQQQIEAKDTMINQQNQIIMATQKNMNDILRHHNELQFSHAKKEELIKQLEFDRSKTESAVRAIAKLERMIDDAIMTKRLKDGIEFSKELMKEKKKDKTLTKKNTEHSAYCIFCGSTVGQISERTNEKVSAVYWCSKCESNYCDQCSYEEKKKQYCMRCDTLLELVEG